MYIYVYIGMHIYNTFVQTYGHEHIWCSQSTHFYSLYGGRFPSPQVQD